MNSNRMEIDLLAQKLRRDGYNTVSLVRACEHKLAVIYKTDPSRRPDAVQALLPLAHKMAGLYRRGEEPIDDLQQAASVGLLKALDRFEPERGSLFASYALPTISGELCRHYRNTGWAVHVPRGTQELAIRIARVERENPGHTPQSLAQSFDVPVASVVSAQIAAGGMRATSLDAPAGAAMEYAAEGSWDAGYLAVENRATLAVLAATLSPRDREILLLRYAGDLSQSEIGARVGISQMQVSRILRRVLAQLHKSAVGAATNPRGKSFPARVHDLDGLEAVVDCPKSTPFEPFIF